jgi:hypothetical protein
MWGVDFQVYWLSVDALVVSSYARSLVLDFAFDLGKVKEPASRYMVEFCPLLLARNTRWSMWYVDFMIVWLVVALAGDVDELKDEWPPGDDAASTRQKISTNDIFEH